MDQANSSDDTFKLLGVIAGIAILVRLMKSFYQWGLRHEQNNSFLFYSCLVGVASIFVFCAWHFAKKKYRTVKEQNEITNGKGEEAVFAGLDAKKKKIFVNLSFRRMHTQVIGTTNAGKTESVITPWMIDDIEKGRGLVFIDGKSDVHLLNKIYAYVCNHGREKDFRVLSLSQVGVSETYNPLIGSVSQVTEKLINSFQIENEYYRTVQFDILRNVLEILEETKVTPTFLKVRQLITNPVEIQKLFPSINSPSLKEWAVEFINISKDKRRELVSGLAGNLGFFTSGEFSSLFNTTKPRIDINEAMNQNQIIYFQLPVLQSPVLGKSVAKMVLQDIQSAVSNRHASGKKKHNFFSIYLDDFTEYLTPQFVSLLNKSRSANVGVVFAHQAIGDLEALGPEIKNQILTNSNLKIFMRTNEPDSAEYFAKVVGTKQGQKVTSRRKDALVGSQVTNDGSIRDAEEFIYHPNIFKSELGLGEAIMILPHKAGTKTVKLKFSIRPDLPVVPLPLKTNPPAESFVEIPDPKTGAQSIATLAAAGGECEL